MLYAPCPLLFQIRNSQFEILHLTSHTNSLEEKKPPLIFNWETSGGQAGPTSEGTWHPERRENKEEAPPNSRIMKKSCHLRSVFIFQIMLISYNQTQLNHYRRQLATKCLSCYEKYHFSVLARMRIKEATGWMKMSPDFQARQPRQMASWSRWAQTKRETSPHSAHRDSTCCRVESASRNCVLFGAAQCRHIWDRLYHEWIFPFSDHCRR